MNLSDFADDGEVVEMTDAAKLRYEENIVWVYCEQRVELHDEKRQIFVCYNPRCEQSAVFFIRYTIDDDLLKLLSFDPIRVIFLLMFLRNEVWPRILLALLIESEHNYIFCSLQYLSIIWCESRTYLDDKYLPISSIIPAIIILKSDRSRKFQHSKANSLVTNDTSVLYPILQDS